MTTVTDDIYLPAPRGPHTTGSLALQLLAVPLAAIGLAVFLTTGLPLGGWGIAVALWCVNRAIQWAAGRFIVGLPQTIAVAVAGIAFLTRAWGVMIALLLTVHFAGKDVAVPAAVLFAVLYTADLATRGLHYASSRRQPLPNARRHD